MFEFDKYTLMARIWQLERRGHMRGKKKLNTESIGRASEEARQHWSSWSIRGILGMGRGIMCQEMLGANSRGMKVLRASIEFKFCYRQRSYQKILNESEIPSVGCYVFLT